LPEEASLVIPDLSSDEALARALAREEEALISAMLPPHPTNYFVPPVLSTPLVSSNTRRSGSNASTNNNVAQPQSSK